MKISLLLGFSLSTCLLLTVLVAADTTEEDIMNVTFENLTADATLVPPAPIGFAAYSADTGNLLFSTSLAADDQAIMREIGGAGNYIVLRTQEQNWCTSLSLEDCRKDAHFISETAFSLAEIVIDPPEPAPVEDTPLDAGSPAIVPETLPIDPLSLIEEALNDEEDSSSPLSSEAQTTSTNTAETGSSASSQDVTDESIPSADAEVSAETSPEVPEPAVSSEPEISSETPDVPVIVSEESGEVQAEETSPAVPEAPSPDPISDDETL